MAYTYLVIENWIPKKKKNLYTFLNKKLAIFPYLVSHGKKYCFEAYVYITYDKYFWGTKHKKHSIDF